MYPSHYYFYYFYYYFYWAYFQFKFLSQQIYFFPFRFSSRFPVSPFNGRSPMPSSKLLFHLQGRALRVLPTNSNALHTYKYNPRDFPRAKGRGKSRGGRGWIFQYLRVLVEYGQSLSINLSTGSGSANVVREGLTVFKSILPC